MEENEEYRFEDPIDLTDEMLASPCQGPVFDGDTVVICGRQSSEWAAASSWRRHLRKCIKRKERWAKQGIALGYVEPPRIAPRNIKAAKKSEYAGLYRSERQAYSNAFMRCTNPKTRSFPRYGGRGIEFRFISFDQFIRHIGPRPSPAHSLDRTNNDGHYEIGNVRWATQEEQATNKSKVRIRRKQWKELTLIPVMNPAVAYQFLGLVSSVGR